MLQLFGVDLGLLMLMTARGQCTAVPPALFGVFREEPRFLDLTEMLRDTDLDLRCGCRWRAKLPPERPEIPGP